MTFTDHREEPDHMPSPWFQTCPQCRTEAAEVAQCEIPPDVRTYPIMREVPLALVACLRCPSRHEWYVLAYTDGRREVVYRATDGRYQRVEEMHLAGDPGRN